MPSAPEGWTGADEWAGRFYESLFYLQSSGVSNKFSEDVFNAAKDAANRKIILISAGVLKSDPSLILGLLSSNEQMNQRLGVFGNNANITANAYQFILVADEPGLEKTENVEKLFAEIASITKNGARANKDMVTKILTQEDMLEGTISNAADLLKQLKRMGISEDLVAGLVGPKAWTDGIKAQKAIAENVVVESTDAEKNKIAFAANALFGVIEAAAT